MANSALPLTYGIPAPGPMTPAPWTPDQESERRRLLGDLRRLDTLRESHLRALREAFQRSGAPIGGVEFEDVILSAHDLRKALEPFDTGEVPF